MFVKRSPASLSVKIYEDAAARYILRAARGWLARRQLERLREADRKFRLISAVATLTIQVGKTGRYDGAPIGESLFLSSPSGRVHLKENLVVS